MLHHGDIKAVESVSGTELERIFESAHDAVCAPENYTNLLANLAEFYDEEHAALINWVQTGQAPDDQVDINYLRRNRWLDETGTRPRDEVYRALGYAVPQAQQLAKPEASAA